MAISNHFNGNSTELRLAGGLVKSDFAIPSNAMKGQRAIVAMDATENIS